MRYLTKYWFKVGYDYPTKLLYNKKDYADNEFLQTLAKGSNKVGEHLNGYFPSGHNLET